MTHDDHHPVESHDEVDSAPAFPPTMSTGSGASTADQEANEKTGRDAQVADREVTRRPVADVPADTGPVEEPALFERGQLAELNGRWSDIQASVVDEPRRAVEQADALVSDVIKEIGDSFSKQRARLEGQWDGGGEASTEDLRQTFQRYRSFFSRLLGL